MDIDQLLAELSWIPRPRVMALRRLGIHTAGDLLTHYPRRHENRQQFPNFRRITPIYPATEGVSQRLLRSLIFRLLEQVEQSSLDVELPAALGSGGHPDALRQIHFPESEEQLAAVRDHLILGEFFRMQMQVISQHAQNATRIGYRHTPTA